MTAKLFPLYNAWWTTEMLDEKGDVKSTCPLGMPMSQNRLAVPTWSYAMERVQPARIIELGTAAGGLTVALAVHAWQIGAHVYTFDLTRPNEKLAPLAKFLGIEFYTGDLWERKQLIADLIRMPGVTFLLCDGGDKPRELATFAQYLKSGDVIASHDYVAIDGPIGNDGYWCCGEVTQAQGDAVAVQFGLESWLQPHFDMAGWLVYRRP